MKRIYIITGANGFLGNNVIRKLEREKDAEIRALVRPGGDTRSLKGLNCKIYYGDATKKETLEEIFDVKEPAEIFVIHCAGVVYIKSKYDPRVYDVNVNGTKNVAAMALEKNAKMVYVSSVHAIPEKPDNETMSEIDRFDESRAVGQYAKTKAEAGNYILDMAREKGLNACVVHPSGLIGPYDFKNTHLTQLIKKMADGRIIACVKGGYDFADVRDVAGGVIGACRSGAAGECYILSNKYYSVKELADMVCEVMGEKKFKIVFPMRLVKFIAPVCELYYEIRNQTPLFTKLSLYTIASNSKFSNEKAKKALGYKTRDMRETIRDTISWLEDNRARLEAGDR